MNQSNNIEEGVISLFRFFSLIQLLSFITSFVVIATLENITHTLPTSNEIVPPKYLLIFSLSQIIFSVIYLWWPPLPRLLGSAFLPIGLFFVAFNPIFEEYLYLSNVPTQQLTESSVSVGVWRLVPILFVPLVLIAWQYGLRMVILFCIATGISNFLLQVHAIGWQTPYIIFMGKVIFVRSISYLAVGYMVTRLITTQRQQRQALAEVNTQLSHYATTLEQLTISRERNRLARELHDTLAHTLSGLAVQLEAMKTMWEVDRPQVYPMLENVLYQTRSGLTETRRALQALRATPLEDLGLTIALQNLAESIAQQNGLQLIWQTSDSILTLPPDIEQCIYRVAQESLENIARHALAQQITVKLTPYGQQVILQISDDGQGFDVAQVDNQHHFGLQGMKERTVMVNGLLEIISQVGQGCTIRLTI